MSKFNFNVETQTVAYAEFDFAGNQKAIADHHKIERVFNFRDLRGNADLLPKYVKKAIKSAGFEAVCLGGTTFSHSVIGLRRAGK